jgi:hypothetical protein
LNKLPFLITKNFLINLVTNLSALGDVALPISTIYHFYHYNKNTVNPWQHAAWAGSTGQ